MTERLTRLSHPKSIRHADKS